MTIDDYLESAPEPHKSTLAELRLTIRSILPEATESLSYGAPAFKVDGKAVAGFAYFKNHCSYLPHSSDVLAELSDELSGYDWSKGALKFAPDSPLPEPLVRRLIAVRMAQLGLA